MTATRPLSFPRLLRRGVRALRVGLLMIGVLTFILAAVAAAGPRIASGVLADELSYRLSSSSANTLDLQASVDPVSSTSNGDFVSAAKTSWAAFPAGLAAMRSRMPSALIAITAPGRFVGRFDGSTHAGILASGAPHGPPKRTLTLSVELNPELHSDAVLVSGRWPSPVTEASTGPLEVVVSAATATELQWHVGESQTLGAVFDGPRTIMLVGTVRPHDPTADYWQLDASRAKAGGIPSTDGEHTTFHGVIWVESASLSTLPWQFGGAAIRSWFPVEGSRVTPESLSSVQSAITSFTASAHSIGSGDDAVSPRYSTNFSLTASTYLDRAGVASGVLSVIEAGPLGTAAALLLLAVTLLVDRRRPAARLQRARGAANGQLRGELAGQLAVAVVPGAVLGVLLGVLISPGALGTELLVTAALAAALPIVVGTALLAPPWAGSQAPKVRRRTRLVVDGVLVLLAALDVLLLVQRGLAGESPGLGADPLLTATPLVMSAAGCALAVRALPPILGAFGGLVRRGRGAVALIGRANSARVGARFLPAFATVTGLAIALFASSILATQQHGLTDAGVGLIGSDIRISAGHVAESRLDRVRALPGVADLTVVDAISGVKAVGQAETFAVFVVNAGQLAAVESDLSPQKRPFPQLGTQRDGHPIGYVGGFLQPVGAPVRLEGGLALTVTPDVVTDAPPKFVSNSPWVVLDRTAIPPAQRDAALQDSILIRVAPSADPDRVVRSIRAIIGNGPLIDSALDRVRSLTASPLVPGLTGVALTAIVLSLVFSVLALLLALVMNAPARAVMLARLRALGFARRQAIGLIAWELAPMVVLGAVVGAILGVLIALLFLSVVDLSTFVGGSSPPVVALDPVLALGSLAIFVVSAAAATLGTAMAATRPSTPSTSRSREWDPS